MSARAPSRQAPGSPRSTRPARAKRRSGIPPLESPFARRDDRDQGDRREHPGSSSRRSSRRTGAAHALARAQQKREDQGGQRRKQIPGVPLVSPSSVPRGSTPRKNGSGTRMRVDARRHPSPFHGSAIAPAIPRCTSGESGQRSGVSQRREQERRALRRQPECRTGEDAERHEQPAAEPGPRPDPARKREHDPGPQPERPDRRRPDEDRDRKRRRPRRPRRPHDESVGATRTAAAAHIAATTPTSAHAEVEQRRPARRRSVGRRAGGRGDQPSRPN